MDEAKRRRFELAESRRIHRLRNEQRRREAEFERQLVQLTDEVEYGYNHRRLVHNEFYDRRDRLSARLYYNPAIVQYKEKLMNKIKRSIGNYAYRRRNKLIKKPYKPRSKYGPMLVERPRPRKYWQGYKTPY